MINLLTPHLTAFFNASLTKTYYLKYFKIARIMTLRKNFIKPTYLPNSYRPITLLNIIDKIMEAILAQQFNRVIKETQILL